MGIAAAAKTAENGRPFGARESPYISARDSGEIQNGPFCRGSSCWESPNTSPQCHVLDDHAVHLEHLGVLAVHVDPVRPRDVPDVLGVRVAAVMLRCVARECR